MSRLLGRACGFQLKYTTRLGPRRRPSEFARFTTQKTDETYTALSTKTLIAGFVARGPPVRAEEVMLLLDASFRQHTPLPNVLRLKVPILHNSNVAPTSAIVGIPKTEQVATFGQLEDANHYGTFSVCGDTHGQFYDLVNIFEEDIGGFPSKSNVYLFNGDFVDRGHYSVEAILTLLSIKLSDPSAMHLLRGNHETKEMSENFGFKSELRKKYPYDWELLYKKFLETFCSLPLAAVIENQGQSPKIYLQ